MDTTLEAARTNSRIVAEYRARTPGSEALAREAASMLPSGITHDARHIDPYGIYVARAEGPRKWDVDGNEYVDYFGGHGALLLGHRHPVVTRAVEAALGAGTHFGANHPGEVRWAAAIQRLVPFAERVRFTSSGTEATLMAVRLARAFTGRNTLLRFKGHFHGWHDHMTTGYASHFDGTPTVGVLGGIAAKVHLLEAGDEAGLAAAFAEDPDIAAAIIEPTGASFGQVPLRPEFLHTLRRLTEQHGAILIFDEVITGFRVSPGGAAAAFGVRPDLASFAKILAGGLPGGAVAGRADILDRLDFAAMARAGQEKVQHPGTFNANPVSAAAGAAALGVIAESDANARALATAVRLRAALNEVFAETDTPWAAYGGSSGFYVFLNPRHRPIDPRNFDPYDMPAADLKQPPEKLASRLRLALLLHGVDVNGRIGGFASVTHGEAEITATAAAFRDAIRMLHSEGELLPG
jgi:glutamate-1-semialdehyde 2,1-aminomutase